MPIPAWSRNRRPRRYLDAFRLFRNATRAKARHQAGLLCFCAGAPKDYASITGKLPADVRIATCLTGAIDMVHLFAANASGLGAKLKAYRAAIKPKGMIWVSWPKKSSGLQTDLTENVLRDTALPLGLVDIKVCAVDETWSGLKFVIPKAQRIKASK